MKKIIVLAFLLSIALTTQANIFPANTHYQVCFTPQKDCTSLIIQQIKQAKQSIYVQAYVFTSWQLAHALTDAHKRGVNVLIILDKSQFKPDAKSRLSYLSAHKIPIWKDDKRNIAHNKIMIFDKKIVETGSFNFTYSAQKYNAENVLIIDNQKLAKKYLDNWFYRMRRSTRISEKN